MFRYLRVTILEAALEDLLKACLLQEKKLLADLFGSQGPLATFSAKSKMAYCLGKLSPHEFRDLETIRSIRNDFAHHAEHITFKTQSVAARCSNLIHNWHEPEYQARGVFTATVSGLLATIHVETLKATPPTQKAEAPITDAMKQQVHAEAEASVIKKLLESGILPPQSDDA